MEKRLLMVKQVLIKAFSLFPAPGRNRTNPMPKPSSAMIAKMPKTARRAEVKPIVDGSNNLAAIIQKKKVRMDWTPVPIMRKYAFLTRGESISFMRVSFKYLTFANERVLDINANVFKLNFLSCIRT